MYAYVPHTRAVKLFRDRDSHECFFRKKDTVSNKRARHARATRPKKRKKPRMLTDKERRSAAREHHGPSVINFDRSPVILGHHQHLDNHPSYQHPDHTILPPPSMHSLLNHLDNNSKNKANLQNLSLTFTPDKHTNNTPPQL